MTRRSIPLSGTASALPADYAPLLAEIKARVQSARIKASLAANRELLALYWDIGRLILDRQKKEGWGAKVIDRLSLDLQQAAAQLGESQSKTQEVVQAPLAQTDRQPETIVQRPVAQLPWRHHTILLDKLPTSEIRLWYAAKAMEHGWSGEVLALQIDAGLHERQGKAVTNFQSTLPPAQSDLAQGITKYALRDLSKPIGVSGYVTKLVDSLPKALKGAIPSVAELERGLAPEK